MPWQVSLTLILRMVYNKVDLLHILKCGMVLNIKNPDVESLAEDAVALTGEIKIEAADSGRLGHESRPIDGESQPTPVNESTQPIAHQREKTVGSLSRWRGHRAKQ